MHSVSASSLLSAPQWFRPQGLVIFPLVHSKEGEDSTEDYLVCYSTRSSIALLTFHGEWHSGAAAAKNCSLSPKAYFSAHHEKVLALESLIQTSLQSTSPETYHLASCGADGLVKVWSQVHSEQPICEMELIVSQETTERIDVANSLTSFTSLETSSTPSLGFHNVLLMVTESGCILVWHLTEKWCEKMRFQKKAGTLISVSPHANNNQRIVAVAYAKSGIVLYEFSSCHGNNEKVKCRLVRLFEMEDHVYNMVWNPRVADMFASSSTDGTVKMWSLEKRAVLAKWNVSPRNARGPGGGGDGYGSNTPVNVALEWSADGDNLVFSDRGNGLHIIRHDSQSPGPHSLMKIKPPLSNEKVVLNVRRFSAAGNGGALLCVLSLDGLVAVVGNGKSCMATYHTSGGIVYDMRINPIDQASLALAVGDNTIRVWKPPSAGTTAGSMKILWRNIKSRVHCLKWHPTTEGLLAFGTKLGAVGCVNVLGERSPISYSNSQHGGTVYQIEWGPPLVQVADGATSPKTLLYSVGNGMILAHTIATMTKDTASDVTPLLTSQCETTVTFGQVKCVQFKQPHCQHLACAYENGSVVVFLTDRKSLQLKPVCIIQTFNQEVHVLEWNPHHQNPQCGYLLASAGLDKTIYVTDLRDALAVPSGETGGEVDAALPVKVISTSLVCLKGHRDRITSLQWCPHPRRADWIASASFDFTATIWRCGVTTGEVNEGASLSVANYRDHASRLYSVCWSPLEEDVVYTSCNEWTVHGWRISDMISRNHIHPPTIKMKPGRMTKGTSGKTSTKEAEDDGGGKEESPQEMPTVNEEVEIVTGETHQHGIASERNGSTSPLESMSSSSNVLPQKPKKKLKSLLAHARNKPGLSKTENLQDFCVHLARTLRLDRQNPGAADSWTVVQQPNWLSIFCPDRAPVIEMMELELAHQSQVEHWDNFFFLLLWRGNVGRIKAAAQKLNFLPDWLVVCLMAYHNGDMERFLDPNLLNMKVKQAVQENPILAATYLVAFGRTEEAVDLLMAQGYPVEALTLARLRFPPGYAILCQRWYPNYAKAKQEVGSYELAACAYLASGWAEDALAVLKKRGGGVGSQRTAWVCLQMAHLTQETSSSTTLTQYKMHFLKECVFPSTPVTSSGAGDAEKTFLHPIALSEWLKVLSDSSAHPFLDCEIVLRLVHLLTCPREEVGPCEDYPSLVNFLKKKIKLEKVKRTEVFDLVDSNRSQRRRDSWDHSVFYLALELMWGGFHSDDAEVHLASILTDLETMDRKRTVDLCFERFALHFPERDDVNAKTLAKALVKSFA